MLFILRVSTGEYYRITWHYVLRLGTYSGMADLGCTHQSSALKWSGENEVMYHVAEAILHMRGETTSYYHRRRITHAMPHASLSYTTLRKLTEVVPSKRGKEGFVILRLRP